MWNVESKLLHGLHCSWEAQRVSGVLVTVSKQVHPPPATMQYQLYCLEGPHSYVGSEVQNGLFRAPHIRGEQFAIKPFFVKIKIGLHTSKPLIWHPPWTMAFRSETSNPLLWVLLIFQNDVMNYICHLGTWSGYTAINKNRLLTFNRQHLRLKSK